MLATQAQIVKTITVAQGKSYTDHISLKPDSKDMDLMVKFVFSEVNSWYPQWFLKLLDQLMVVNVKLPPPNTSDSTRITHRSP